MAEIQYGEVGADTPPVSSAFIASMISWLGALVSVTLIAGLTWWGYQLMVRDVSGVPVVRALEGPMRITPLDPGGSSAQHQGLAVNNIAAAGEAEAPADRLVLAPKPTTINSDDQTAAVLEETIAAQADVDEQAAAVEPGADEITQEQSAATLSNDQASLIEATLRLVEGNDSPSTAADEPSQNADGVIASSVPGISSSLYPTLRPAGLLISSTVQSDTTGVSQQFGIIQPSEIVAGTRLAQLGAFDTPDEARAAWLTISTKFDDVMAGKSQVIEQSQSGGKVFYRLRAHGFEGLSDARRFCSTLLASQANCIPVVTR